MTTKKEVYDGRVRGVKTILSTHISENNAIHLSEQLIRGADGGLEIVDFEKWIEERFKPQLVWMNNDDYTRAITRALPQALKFAAADFGSSRQRDLGQLWTDTARGFLGEIAFQRFLQERYTITIEHDITMDKSREEYIATDIKAIKDATNGNMRLPKLNVSVKTGKFNARWMDEYAASKTARIDALVFVRVGTVREHFIAFLKAISFISTKLFPAAEKLGELTAKESQELWKSIPEFEPIPAYISGFLLRRTLRFPIHEIHINLVGRKNQKIVLSHGVGNFSLDVLRADERIKAIDPDSRLPIVIDGIGCEVTDTPHFFANTGALSFGSENWRAFLELI
jgi:hypothetical protein